MEIPSRVAVITENDNKNTHTSLSHSGIEVVEDKFFLKERSST